MLICKSISYNVEPISEKASITVRGERLDFKTLLARASAGILDLNQFVVPRSSDLSGSIVVTDPDKLEKQKLELLNEPNSVMNNLFGASLEDAKREYEHFNNVAQANRKPKASDSVPDPEPKKED